MAISMQSTEETLPNSRLLGAVMALREAIKASHELRELAHRHRSSWSNARSLQTLADRLEALLEHEDQTLTADGPAIPNTFNASADAMAALRDIVARLVHCARALRYYAGQLEHTDPDVHKLHDEARRLQEYSHAIGALIDA